MNTSRSLLTSAEVADILQVSTKTLANWRHLGRVPFVKVNGLVRYRTVEISEWLASAKTPKRAVGA